MHLERRQGMVEALQVRLREAGHLAQAELPQVPPQEAEAVADQAPLVRVARRCLLRALRKRSGLRAA